MKSLAIGLSLLSVSLLVSTPAAHGQSAPKDDTIVSAKPAAASSTTGGNRGANCRMKNASERPGAAAARRGNGHGGGQGAGHGRRMRQRGNSEDHAVIHSLMAAHKSIERKVTEIPNGVRTDTVSKDPDVAKTLKVHVDQMKARVASGQPIRMFDPLFREIFSHHEKIEMKIEEIEGGVRVTQTSADPQVVLLIREHARVVNEFTAEGMARMHQTSPLPEGYKAK
jgi:hypothetical protein